jgi:hypothetical protein
MAWAYNVSEEYRISEPEFNNEALKEARRLMLEVKHNIEIISQ